MSDQPPEVTDAFLLKLLNTIAQGPVGAMLLDLANGKRQLVVKEHPTGSGWVIRSELIIAPSPGCAAGTHVDLPGWRCASCGAAYGSPP